MDPRVRQLVEELDRLVPTEGAEVILYDEGRERPPFSLPFLANEAGLLRFGLAFMKAAFAPSQGKGRNGGDEIEIDLAPIYRSDSNVEFLCERVSSLPETGDRRRPREVPRFIGLPILLFVLWCLILGLLQMYRMMRAFF
jgi:hypothetical protein